MPGSENRDEIGLDEAYNFFENRFEVKIDEIKGIELEKISGDFWIVSENGDGELETETRGIRALRDTGKFLKPTTYVLQILDEEISRNTVELDKEDLKKILDGDMVPAVASEEGYVAIIFEGKTVGCGLYKDHVVSSRISKGRGKELLSFL